MQPVRRGQRNRLFKRARESAAAAVPGQSDIAKCLHAGTMGHTIYTRIQEGGAVARCQAPLRSLAAHATLPPSKNCFCHAPPHPSPVASHSRRHDGARHVCRKKSSPLQCGCTQRTPPRAAACLKAQNQRLSLENHALPTKMGAAHPGSWTAWGTSRTHCCSRPADKTRRSPKMYSPGAVTSLSKNSLFALSLPCPALAPQTSSQLTSSPTARPKIRHQLPNCSTKKGDQVLKTAIAVLP